jgi:DNA-binding transcriptional MerR regulator
MENTNYFLLGDVARILRCQPYQIVYLLTTRQVPEPALRMGNRRVFTLADVQQIGEKLQLQIADEPAAHSTSGKKEDR